MKNLLFVFGLMLSIITLDAQEKPNGITIKEMPNGIIKRYDFKEVGKWYYNATFSVLVITDCNTNEKGHECDIMDMEYYIFDIIC